MSTSLRSWGNVVFQYSSRQFKPKQIEEAVKSLPESRMSLKGPVYVDLSRKDGVNTATIINAYPERHGQPRNAVIQCGGRNEAPTTLLQGAVNLIKLIRSNPKPNPVPKPVRLKPLPSEDLFHHTPWGTKVHYFDPPHPID